MVSFRRCILALAILALFTGLASAQITTGTPTGSSAGALTCSASVASPTQVRAQGYAELLGDILITCTGGTVSAPGTPVPLANITVALNNTIVTSRVFSNSLSEALLLIDEPGASGTNAAAGPGTLLPQQLCVIGGTGTNGSPNGAGIGGCGALYANYGTLGVGADFSRAAFCQTVSGNGNCGTFASTPVPNVFQGQVSGNQVIFNGVPILAPVTGGYTRIFRITNIRGNASQFAGQSGTFQGQVPILASISVSSAVVTGPQNPVQTTAFLFDGLGTTVVRNNTNSGTGSSALNLLQCNTAGITAGAALRFPEGFAAAFKTRFAATSSLSGAGTNASNQGVTISCSLGGVCQNNPGAIYNGGESGFIFPVGGNNAGVADFGTRLKATFNNVPTGANIYVSTTNLPLTSTGGLGANLASLNTGGQVNLLSAIPVSTSSIGNNLLAALVVSETAGASTLGSFLPLQTGTNNAGSGGVNIFGPLPVDSTGTATAVWEILTANPSAFETAEFAVYYSYTGNPATNTPPTSPVGTVSMSFAPTFSSPTASSVIPRFVPPSTSSPLISFALCSTTLLYPYVTATNGIDTGIAIANTSQDPWGTRTQSGTCTLNWYGTGAGTPNTTTTTSIAAGAVYAELASTLKPGFTGYVFAVCNFQLAHGFALVSDTGLRNWATNYLALVIPTGTGTRNGQDVSYNPNKGAVEGAYH